jgi:integrase/recombinase XerD
MAIHITTKNKNEIHVRFEYSEEKLRRIKTFSPRRWDSIYKVWILRNSTETLQKLIEIFNDEEVFFDTPGNPAGNKEHAVVPDSLIENNSSYESAAILKELSDLLKLKGYSFKTRKSYVAHVRRLIEYYKKRPEDISESEIRSYLVYLLDETGKSHSYINQLISAIKLLYNDVLKHQRLTLNIPRPKKERKLPTVLSEDEVYKILESLKNVKHRAILFIIYSAGLRVGEVVRLRLEDIDSDRMLIRVVQGKGRKDRYTMLSPYALEKLKLYMELYKPETWLFPGGNGRGHLTERTVEKVFEQASMKTDVIKHSTPHTFRHSFATHSLENGYDIRFIQELLGHTDPKTTQIYTHVTKASIQKIQSPLDIMMNKKKK